MPTPFVVHDPSFLAALGESPQLRRVCEIDAHEGPVYVAEENAVYITSRPDAGHDTAIRRIPLDDGLVPSPRRPIEDLLRATTGANGMALAPDGHLLVCVQGSMTQPAALHASIGAPALDRWWSTGGAICR